MRNYQTALQFHVQEKEHQCVDIEVTATDVIVCTLHLSPTEAQNLVKAIVEELPPFLLGE